MNHPAKLQILFEDNHCLAVFKPAGMLTMGDRTGDVSMVELAREYLRRKYNKPGNVFVGVVHRLDRPVSGVLLFARTSKGAARLSEQFREHTVRKMYHAVVEGRPTKRQGELVDWIAKDETTNTSRLTTGRAPKAKPQPVPEESSDINSKTVKEARLGYRCLKSAGRFSLLEIDLQTGRSHQIRVQLSSARPADLWRHKIRIEDSFDWLAGPARGFVNHRTSDESPSRHHFGTTSGRVGSIPNSYSLVGDW